MTDGGRLSPTQLVEEAWRVIGSSFADIVPPQAQVHLLNAQRELLLALAVTVEHNTSRGRKPTRASGGRSKAGRTPSRVELD